MSRAFANATISDLFTTGRARRSDRYGRPVHVHDFSYGGPLGQSLALDHPHLLRSLIIANSLHGPEMWQANPANINAELAQQHPDVWDRAQAH